MKRHFIFIGKGLILLSLVSFHVGALTGLEKGADGWTILRPSEDSRLIYVSESLGNDEAAEVYSVAQVGEVPQQPRIEVKAFRTYAKALEQAREGAPDWILVLRGDTFRGGAKLRSGRSPGERFVLTSYGEKKQNPLFKTGNKTGVQQCCRSFANIAIQGLDFYAHTRDPASLDYVSSEGGPGFRFYIRDGQEGNHLLVEGNRFRFFGGNSIQGPGTYKGIVFRRNSFFDSYSTNSHSSGFYARNLPIVLEENIFDHNGWQRQADDENGKEQGAATIYNHNTYCADMKDTRFEGNVFLRSSSIQNKWTANSGVGSSANLHITNNFYFDGEIGMSIGGNKDGAFRFKNIQVEGNVMMNIGESQPTGRTLGWGMELRDWDGGLVRNNYFLNQVKPEVKNSFGLKIFGTTRNVLVEKNIFTNLLGARALILAGGGKKENIRIVENQFVLGKTGRELVDVQDNFPGYELEGNQYFHDKGKNHFRLAKEELNWEEWDLKSPEMGALWAKPGVQEWKDPGRSLGSYHKSIGGAGSSEAFVKAIRQISFLDWDERYLASAINEYIRAGFKPEGPPM